MKQPDPTQSDTADEQPLLLTEDLIEEVSIDGMCGVY
jgi:mycofactocin precursor